jgi:SET domain-containing protein 6
MREELRGTELEAELEGGEEDFKEDFETCIEALDLTEEERLSGDFTFERFKAAASIAASRAFYVGGKYGECLVPCADLFNHRTGENTVAVYGVEDEVEDDSDEDETFDGDKEDDEDDDDDDNYLVIKTVKSIKAGEELFNTFGEQSNASLLHKYGFCEAHNADTAVVTLDVSVFEEAFGKEKMHDVYERLSAANAFELKLFDGEYYEVDRDGSIAKELCNLVSGMFEVGGLDGVVENRQTAILKIIDARLARYGDLGDLNKELRSTNKPPAGGGVVFREAARLVKRQEVELLQRAREKTLRGDQPW